MQWQFFVLCCALGIVAVSCDEETIPEPDTAPLVLPGKTDTSNNIALTQTEEDPDETRRFTGNCPFYEQFIECPNAHTCQRTCATLNHACLITPTCTAACFCKDGYARDASNRCVPISECPGTSCPRNEQFIVCDQNWKCEKTCAGRNAECPVTAFCRGGCQCREGFYRDTSGLCVKAKNCVQVATNAPCPHKEIWKECWYDCAEVCNADYFACIFSSQCRPGCFCEDGVRIGGKCLPSTKCPRV